MMIEIDLKSRSGATLAFSTILLLTSAGFIFISRDLILALEFRDADDYLRLVQVRDWMAGQGWFNVTQYRINPPEGVLMHWNRLVDVPIRFMIQLFSLAFSGRVAEVLALIVVPLFTYFCLLAGTYALTFAITMHRETAILACFMMSGLLQIVSQILPMRIDHHGWQIALGVLATFLMLRDSNRRERDAWMAGAIMAISLVISLEGLPLAAALGGLGSLRFLRDCEAGDSLIAYMFGLCVGCFVLLLATLGVSGAVVGWCDAMSPAYLAPLFAMTLGVVAARSILPSKQVWHRLTHLVLAVVLALATFRLFGSRCLSGPFGDLDPLVRAMWYEYVREGLPVWRQSAVLIPMLLVPSVLGLAGALLAYRFDSEERRERWLEIFLLQLATFVVSVLVVRASGLAHTLALPGMAWLAQAAFFRTRQLRTLSGRVLLGWCCAVALTPISALAISAGVYTWEGPSRRKAAELKDYPCFSPVAQDALQKRASTLVLAPLDIGPFILFHTSHSVVGTGHHRNIHGMKTVIGAFTKPPAEAEVIIRNSTASYFVYCDQFPEVDNYITKYPSSLTAALVRNEIPVWLQPADEPLARLRIFRIKPPS